jgi:hypothetical protein
MPRRGVMHTVTEVGFFDSRIPLKVVKLLVEKKNKSDCSQSDESRCGNQNRRKHKSTTVTKPHKGHVSWRSVNNGSITQKCA